ncbi:TetR family transcriptional regulator [Agrilactobacillus composti DSM 18527 = JCM 14202]|uniref:TetR family transcriptional regulator n=2 Tax=Agrilactobacillus TaxID=2767875 RepID=A0A0R1XLP5_9LACO|nr:TetR family transcriptional regulator [Agrilactobacillus composti DSM 18527 = JCM 14202]
MTAKQKQIISAAIDLFSEKGYANTSTKEIAAKAAVAEGNIFSTFHNKRGLLEAIINPVLRSIFPTTAQLSTVTQPAPYKSLRDYMYDFCTERLAFLKANRQVIKIFVAEIIYNDKLRQRLIKDFPASNRYWLQMADNLDQLKAQKLLVNWDNIKILKTIWSVMGGSVLGYLFFDQPIKTATLEQNIDTATRLLAYR